jgi:hypothetical protein
MGDVLDLAAARDKRTRPDPQFVTVDEAGRQMFAFFADYRLGDAVFGINFFAYDFDDAERRLLAMRSGLSLCGQIYCEV